MENYRRILAAVDLCGMSDLIVRQAATMAFKLNTELVILHVIDQDEWEVNQTYKILLLVCSTSH